ncbi:hypothetical protein GO013_11615 [Pseudodesulfovibrio sp. JC047]|uniref:hypothetical protein n=1 Tax=Pseudodesulfovibrio sp. JC047 TaxID=2683199 RepID=UPI0013D358E3|nr:hypothetical protein [Pseudodesulfovibrio sp. JC047]NDV20063.1 hypothetical protein [Pseudodesulfovibrio sp. JC047]
MPDHARMDLIQFLEQTNADVLRLEKEGEEALQREGQRAFQVKLEEKAKLLAALGENAWEYTEKIEGALGAEIATQLEQFSTSAGAALRIGSVFFMTALLYPEDHKPGDPNDLAVFIEELRQRS